MKKIKFGKQERKKQMQIRNSEQMETIGCHKQHNFERGRQIRQIQFQNMIKYKR